MNEFSSPSISPRIHCFSASWQADAQVLILGSMPGVASLEAQQYYAHPRNAFWQLMDDLLGVERTLPYSERLALLRQKKVALWDVIGRCAREGSLDSTIEKETIEPNPLPELLRQLPRLRLVVCNGGTAYQLCKRHFGKRLAEDFPGVEVMKMPSTSPAYASKRYEQKRQEWAVIAGYL